jgi:hypothetical protein
MTSAKSGAVIVALGLLACGLSPASVRMDGLGPNLAGLIDDPVSDLLSYPQLNVLTPGWLVGVETNQSDYYHPYARTTGRLSVAAALAATLGDTAYDYAPSLALAAQAGKLSIGVATTVSGLGGWAIPPGWLIQDTTPSWMRFFRGDWQVTLGTRWNGPGFTLDGDVGGSAGDEFFSHVRHDSVYIYDYYEWKSLTPSLRIGWPGQRLSWRGIIGYHYLRLRRTGPNWTNPQVSLDHTLSLSGGPTFTAGDLLACAGLRLATNPTVPFGLTARLPAGIEWSPGPVIFRLGTDPRVLYSSDPRVPRELRLVFWNSICIGLGLRPVEHLRLDFVPDMDNAANLSGWSLAAAFDF